MFGDERGVVPVSGSGLSGSGGPVLSPTVQIPSYDLTAAAGSGRAVLEDSPSTFVAFPSDWAREFTGPASSDQGRLYSGKSSLICVR